MRQTTTKIIGFSACAAVSFFGAWSSSARAHYEKYKVPACEDIMRDAETGRASELKSRNDGLTSVAKGLIACGWDRAKTQAQLAGPHDVAWSSKPSIIAESFCLTGMQQSVETIESAYQDNLAIIEQDVKTAENRIDSAFHHNIISDVFKFLGIITTIAALISVYSYFRKSRAPELQQEQEQKKEGASS